MRGRLQRASGFCNGLILAAVRTECTRVIRCRKNLADRLAQSIGSRKEKDVVGQLSIAFQNLPRLSVSTKLQRHVWVKEIAVTSVASVKQLPVVSFGF